MNNIAEKDCPSYETCSAPLCPLDIGNHVFFPDEDICKKRNPPAWVRTQKKIAKRAVDRDTYYTIDMLLEVKRVTAHISGADPDKVNDEAWIKGRAAARA